MSTIEPKQTKAQRLWMYFRRYILWFLVGALALLATNYLGLKIPEYIGSSIQTMRDHADSPNGFAAVRGQLVMAGVSIIGLAIAAMVARIISRIMIFNAGRFIEFDVRNELYQKLTTLGPSYYNKMTTGDVTSRVTNDVSYIRLLYAIGFLHIVNTVFAYSIALQKMLAIDWQLTLWCLAPFPFLLMALRHIVLQLFQHTKAVQAQMSMLSTKVQENLSGMAVVKSFNLQGYESDKFAGESHSYYEKNMTLAVYRGLLQAVVFFVAGLGTSIVLLIAAPKVVAGTMPLGQFIEFNGYVVSLAFPTIAMGWVFSVWHRGQAGFDRALEVLDHPPTLPEEGNPQALPEAVEGKDVGAITLKDVDFTYPNTDTPILKNINLTIPAGSKVAIVGKTGSGKSTLVKLLTRMYDPNDGTIAIDGCDLRTLALRQMRSQIGVVGQDPFLFSMTVGQNIRFGLDALEHDNTIDRPAPTSSLLNEDSSDIPQEERIREAMTVAGLASDIGSFKDGLETIVGERGITLSGGQKQRTTIARAVLIDPRILILDDALSSVDTQTEALILDHLDNIMDGRTTILITHRFNALDRMDKIIVIDDGEVVEMGHHDELLAMKDGQYAKIYEQQKLREQLET